MVEEVNKGEEEEHLKELDICNPILGDVTFEIYAYMMSKCRRYDANYVQP
jgi:hypothetical protein